MSDEAEDFEDIFNDETEQEPEAAAPEAAEPEPEPVKGETEQPEAVEPEPEAEPAPPAGEDKENLGRLSALLDEREKRQEAERKAREAEAKLAQFENSRQAQQQPIDPIDDPAGFAAQQREHVERVVTQSRIQQSRVFAEQQHGADVVEAAYAAFETACNTDPATSAMSTSLLQHPHPIGEVVSWYKRQQTLESIGDDPEAYRQRIIDEYLAQQPATPQATPAPTPPVKVPPSLAKGGGSTGQEDVSDDDAFSAAFR